MGRMVREIREKIKKGYYINEQGQTHNGENFERKCGE